MRNIFILFIQSIVQFQYIFKFWLFFLIIGALFRAFYVYLFDLHHTISIDLFYLFIYGFRMDTIVYCAFWLVGIFLHWSQSFNAMRFLLSLAMSIYIFFELISYGFLRHFSVRPNYLFVDHVADFNEIFTMVYALYPVFTIFVFLCITISYLVFNKYFLRVFKDFSAKKSFLGVPFIVLVLALGARSSLDSSTPNSSFYAFSQNAIYNEIANNAIFSVLYAVYLSKQEVHYDYGKIEAIDAIKRIQSMYQIENSSSTLEREQTSFLKKKKNIILIVLESFGHEYVGYLGGKDATPNIDELCDKSMCFANMYAVGTRTSWGISSILSSLYPLPSREYVKAAKSQKDFYTAAQSLKKELYENIFLYSGSADFDNMRGFLLANGYDKVYGKENFDANLTKYTWGYCDEDLYDKALEIIRNKNNIPYFLTLLTLSSHEPFDYPKGIVKPIQNEPLEGFANSIKYADYALGNFIEKLKLNGLLDDVVIGIIADHNPSVKEDYDVSVHKYKIPALIYRKDFDKKYIKKYKKIASQIDFMPTLLDCAGVSVKIPTMGASVVKVQRNSALLVAQKRNFAYITENEFVLYKPKNTPKTFDLQFNEIPTNEKRSLEGLSFIKASQYLYESKKYH